MIDLSYIIPDNKARNMKETINIKYNNKTYVIPKPFNQCYFGSEPTKETFVANRFNDVGMYQGAMLPAFAVAIYDTIIGAEQTEDYDLMQKGLDWFRKYFAKEYMVLLD